jgi:hypothetical protein
MQGFARTREKPPAREQWRAMEKTMRRTMETMGYSTEDCCHSGKQETR